MEAPRGYSVLSTISATGTVPVDCKTLDAWRAERGLAAVDLFKVDVEGHEMSLLRGAPETLKASRHLFIEVKSEHLPEFDALARAAGFTTLSRQDLFTGDAMVLLARSAA
jgi:hypothetical protein